MLSERDPFAREALELERVLDESWCTTSMEEEMRLCRASTSSANSNVVILSIQSTPPLTLILTMIVIDGHCRP